MRRATYNPTFGGRFITIASCISRGTGIRIVPPGPNARFFLGLGQQDAFKVEE